MVGIVRLQTLRIAGRRSTGEPAVFVDKACRNWFIAAIPSKNHFQDREREAESALLRGIAPDRLFASLFSGPRKREREYVKASILE